MYKQNKTQLATKLYNQGIKRFFEEVKQSDWRYLFRSEFISLLYDETEIIGFTIGNVELKRISSSVISGSFESWHFGNVAYFAFEKKTNSEFQEVSDFMDLCFQKFEDYCLERVSELKVRKESDQQICMVDRIKSLGDGDDKSLTEEEMDQIVSEVEKKWESPKNSLEIDTFIPHEEEPETKTEDSAETEIVNSTKTMTEEETSRAVQEYQNRTGSNKRGRKSKKS